MYAIIKTGGKQYRVSVGDVVYVEKLNAQEEENVEFDVIAVGKEDGMVVGTPVVEGAKVAGKVIKNGKSKKGYCIHLQIQKRQQTQNGPQTAIYQS